MLTSIYPENEPDSGAAAQVSISIHNMKQLSLIETLTRLWRRPVEPQPPLASERQPFRCGFVMTEPRTGDSDRTALLTRIVSGGQTGVDRGALDAALERDFPCGGHCPAGRKAEDGPISDRYPLVALDAGGYRERTVRNVVDSDATLILYWSVLEGGTEQTMLHCVRRQKPYKLIDASVVEPGQAAALARAFVELNGIRVLNVAGPRESRWSGAHAYAREAISGLIGLQT